MNLYETFKLPISGATADFNIAPHGTATALTLHYNYQLNLMGRAMKRTTDKRMRKGMNGLADDLQRESQRMAGEAA